MARPKIYDSEAFLRRRYFREHKTIEQIADECKVTPRTIRNNLKKYGIIK